MRDDALHLLDVLSSRIWKDIKDTKVASAEAAAALAGQPSDQNPGRVAVVIGNLQDSYQQFQYQLSAKLARYRHHSFSNAYSQLHADSIWQTTLQRPHLNVISDSDDVM